MATRKKKPAQQKKVEYVTKTDNKSALKLHKDLKKAEIKNNNFFMALMNEEVKDKDPYSQTLQYDDVRNINIECEDNMWYYLRECLWLRDGIGTTSMCNYPFTKQAIAAFWLVSNGYNIILQMNKKDSKCIAHAIMLYFHQCGPKKHFEIVSVDDEGMYSQSEYAAYYFLTPGYVFAQNNFDPIVYDTQEVLVQEMAYTKTGGYLYVEDIYEFDDLAEGYAKWEKGTKRPVLIATIEKNPVVLDCNKETQEAINKTTIDWQDSFYDNQKEIEPFKKKGFVRIIK